MLKSLWGKFGQRENLMQVRVFYDPNPFRLFMDTDQHDVHYVSCLDEHLVEVHYRSQAGSESINPNINILIAAFTTFWAHLRLYDALETLRKRVLYYDTDPVIYVEHGDEANLLAPGRYLGEFTSELGFNQHTLWSFARAGQKATAASAMMGRLRAKSKATT